MWIDEQKSSGTQAFLGVYLWLNWAWWESYLNIGISDEPQIAVVVWLQCQ